MQISKKKRSRSSSDFKAAIDDSRSKGLYYQLSVIIACFKFLAYVNAAAEYAVVLLDRCLSSYCLDSAEHKAILKGMFSVLIFRVQI